MEEETSIARSGAVAVIDGDERFRPQAEQLMRKRGPFRSR
jgi:hypothetical protein